MQQLKHSKHCCSLVLLLLNAKGLTIPYQAVHALQCHAPLFACRFVYCCAADSHVQCRQHLTLQYNWAYLTVPSHSTWLSIQCNSVWRQDVTSTAVQLIGWRCVLLPLLLCSTSATPRHNVCAMHMSDLPMMKLRLACDCIV